SIGHSFDVRFFDSAKASVKLLLLDEANAMTNDFETVCHHIHATHEYHAFGSKHRTLRNSNDSVAEWCSWIDKSNPNTTRSQTSYHTLMQPYVQLERKCNKKDSEIMISKYLSKPWFSNGLDHIGVQTVINNEHLSEPIKQVNLLGYGTIIWCPQFEDFD
ncbi:hypothetical protein M8C21_033267, partial [Ambrosia artemisiifolia]